MTSAPSGETGGKTEKKEFEFPYQIYYNTVI